MRNRFGDTVLQVYVIIIAVIAALIIFKTVLTANGWVRSEDEHNVWLRHEYEQKLKELQFNPIKK